MPRGSTSIDCVTEQSSLSLLWLQVAFSCQVRALTIPVRLLLTVLIDLSSPIQMLSLV